MLGRTGCAACDTAVSSEFRNTSSLSTESDFSSSEVAGLWFVLSSSKELQVRTGLRLTLGECTTDPLIDDFHLRYSVTGYTSMTVSLFSTQRALEMHKS